MTNVDITDARRLANERREAEGDVNEALMDWVLKILEEEGYKAFDVECRESGDSIRCRYVSFRLKNVWRGWRWGLWLYGDELLLEKDDDHPVLWFFVQHETLIDEFKPSHSPMSVDIRWREIEYGLKWAKMKIVRMVERVRRHPVLVYDGADVTYLSKGSIALSCAKTYAYERLHELKERVSYEFWRDVGKSMAKTISNMPGVSESRLCDRGMRWRPPLELCVTMEDDPSDEDVDRVLSVIRRRNHGHCGFCRCETLMCDVMYKVNGEWMTPDFE